MRLISLTVKNYRVHREQRVEFDAERTLIGGPNESGKSTLMEAAHRALFLKAKGKTELHLSMNSIHHPGHPEVELEFSAHGQRYQIHKIFSGAKGVTRLTQTGGKTWQDVDAEEKLDTLLGTESLGGAGVAGKIRAQWAHLWIWQGDSGLDPVQYANTERSTLMQRLQTQGGAAVMQSELDARVIEQIARQVEETFTLAGEPRATSELGRARLSEKDADDAEIQARANLEKRQNTVSDYEQASLHITSAESALTGIVGEQNELETRRLKTTKLQREEEEQTRLVHEAERHHDVHTTAHRAITELQSKIVQLRSHQEPRQNESERLQVVEQNSKIESEAAEKQAREAEKSVQAAHAHHDLAQAHLFCEEKKDAQKQLRLRWKKLEILMRDHALFDKEHAALPVVDAATLRTFQTRERDAAQAQATLKGMATAVELLASDLPVKVNGERVQIGAPVVVTEDSEIQIGPGIRLRIRPGGGLSLAEARRLAEHAQNSFAHALQKLGITSLADAVAIEGQRAQLQSKLKESQAEMNGMGVETIRAELQKLDRDLAAAEAEVQRRQQALSLECVEPLNLQACRESLRQAERELQAYRAVREAAVKRQLQAEQAYKKNLETVRLGEEEIRNIDMRLTLLTEQHGNDSQRTEAIQSALALLQTHQAKLKSISYDLSILQPDLIKADEARIKRSLDIQNAKRESAITKRTEAAALLRSDGSHDPVAAHAYATARADSARQQRAVIERRSTGLRLLHDLFQQEQERLADQFTHPLSERASQYLQRLFGRDAQLTVSMDGTDYSALSLSRGSQGALNFQTLSGGAREQVAAAFRLAMAEILAEAQDGCLPVIFDDAFAHSDPARVQALQRMLDLAATRGLQVILLTCNPDDYTALGASEINLPYHV